MTSNMSFLALALFAAPALATEPLVLSNAQPAQLLPAPPADGSAEQKKELAEIKNIQAHMSATDYAKAKSDNDNENVIAFASTIGPWFDIKKMPKTAALFEAVYDEEEVTAKPVKTYFHRTRPWHIDTSLKTCERGKNFQSSYPSGHTTRGYSIAIVLTHLLPDQSDAIMARAKNYAENRLVCGVHYRSDIVAGQVLGTLIAQELLANAKFKSDFDAAKAEIDSVRPH